MESTHLDSWLKAIAAAPKLASDTGVHHPFNDDIRSVWGRKGLLGGVLNLYQGLFSSIECSVPKLAGTELQLVGQNC